VIEKKNNATDFLMGEEDDDVIKITD
jgi:hypothetical protein